MKAQCRGGRRKSKPSKKKRNQPHNHAPSQLMILSIQFLLPQGMFYFFNKKQERRKERNEIKLICHARDKVLHNYLSSHQISNLQPVLFHTRVLQAVYFSSYWTLGHKDPHLRAILFIETTPSPKEQRQKTPKFRPADFYSVSC